LRDLLVREEAAVKLSVSIAHARHLPGRTASLARMMPPLADVSPVWFYDGIGKPHEWSLRQWENALREPGATHALLLNDDLILCPNFLAVLANVIAARPAHLINLFNCHQLATDAQRRGMSWLTSSDGLIGHAYVLPVPALRAFLAWRESALIGDTVEVLSEDQILNLWAMVHGCLIWHTVPALVEHDTSVPSCYGNTQCRSATVGPRAGMLDVNWDSDALHIGRVFAGNHHALLTRVKGDREHLVRRYYELAGEALF
jgi:hypothetical protein